MKEQITTWLFLLLLGSSYNVETARSQNAIQSFPYELTSDTYDQWTLGEGHQWLTNPDGFEPVYGFTGGNSYEYTTSPLFNYSSLNNPEITFMGSYFLFETLDESGQVLYSQFCDEENKTLTVSLDKASCRFRFSKTPRGTIEIKNLVVGEAGTTDQSPITQFPYTLKPQAGGWVLTNGEWGVNPLIKSAKAYELISPKINFPDGGGLLTVTGIVNGINIYGSSDRNTYELLNHTQGSECKTLITKDIHYLKLLPSNRINAQLGALIINGFTETLSWVAEDDTYTLTGTECNDGQIAYCWLPEISWTIESGTNQSQFISFKIESTSLDNIELFFVEKGTFPNNTDKETPINITNGMVTINMGYSTSGVYKITPGFKVVSKGGKVPKVTISKFSSATTNGVMQFDLNHWYDEDRDGQMEFFYGGSKTHISYWKNYGKYKIINGVPVKYENFPENISLLMPCSTNNDASVDFCGGIAAEAYDKPYFVYKIYSNSEQGDTQESQIFSTWGTSRITKKRGEIFVPCDYNNDGITDFLLPDSKVAVRLPDGTYEIHQLEVLTQEEYRNRDKTDDQWSQNGGGGVVVQNRNDAFLSGNDMFIGGKGEYTGSMGYQASSIDFNKDGYPDIVNTGTGEILIYVAKDKYVGLPIGGAIYFRDLNNDQRLDYIVYEPTGKTVTAHVYQADGTEKEQKLISNLSMDQRVWCYDFDKDGDIDILLPFSYHYSNGAAYLVVMENDGKGKFKMHETSFDEELEFVACADIDHDGYYDVVAKYPKPTASVAKDVLLLKGNNKRQFQLQPTPLIRLEENSGTSSSNREYEIQVADINNDGYYDIMAQYYSTENRGQMSRIYPVNDLLSNITANQAPQKPEKPTYLFEPSTGLLKVNWQLGKDAESSAVDLTYALRIGTEPGKGDIFYAHAMPDGTRLNLLDGNMGYSLDRILDASGWNAGKYYIAIQAIDPMHNGSAWSEEAVFEKTQLSSGFRITDERTVGDTLTLALTSPRDLSIEYKWDLAGATVISKSKDETVYQIQFTTPGEKRITLQTANSNGEVSVTTDQNIFIFPNRILSEKLSASPETTARGAIDLDNDGIAELLTGNGVYENDGKGNYCKIKKIYNTNLSFVSSYSEGMCFTDINKDGLADIMYSTSNVLHQYINQGDKILSEESYENRSIDNTDFYVDFNHDGYMDLIKLGGVYLNAGNNIDFTETDYDGNFIADFNNDGFYDIVRNYYYSKNGGYVMYLNNGDGSFLQCPLTVPSEIEESGIKISAVADMNNDGYPDLLIQKNENTILILLNNKNEDFKEMKEITLPMKLDKLEIGKIFDFDNNGYLDLSLLSSRNGSILYFYDGLQTKFINYGDNRYDYNGIGRGGINKHTELDVDKDGIPDFIETDKWSSSKYYRNLSNISNTSPETPSNIRGAQADDYAIIKWDAAKDVETPYAQMRYNISVKKQGQTGEESFIISPMNDLNAGAEAIPDFIYQTATTYSIPLSALPTGTYEVQVQAIDGWNATSAFTEPYILKVEANPQMQVPTAVCASSVATVVYTGNASASGLTWNWDGGRLLYQHNNDKNYEVVWDTAGKKLISVTSDGVTSTAEIWVSPAINPEYSINSQALYATETPMTLPEGDYEFSWSVSQNGSEFKALSEYRVPPVRIVRNGNTNQAKVTFMSEGDFVLRLHVYTPCGGATCDRNIKVTDMLSGQEINLVTIDPATGKFNISWQYATELPAFVSNVNIYKEGNKYNDFHLLATVPVSHTSYVDITSNPQILASRYRLTLQTNYGAETTPGKPHQGVHAMVNKGAGNGWNITWSQYEGTIIETYRILRGSSPDNLAMIAEVSGNATSYSDLNAPAGTLYYALDFDAKYENNWKPMKAYARSRANSIQVRSNIVSTEGAAQVIFAEDILVQSMEEPVLSPEQTSIHLTADVYPLNATFRAVNWTVISGSDIATVSSNGVLTAIGDKNGSITVRASAIDGSDVYAEMTIITDGLTSINAWEKKDNVLIYPSPVTDVLNIKNMPEANGSKNKIYIVNLNGQLMHAEETENTEASISCGSYATGVYLLKIVSEDKVTTRRFMKK